MTGSANVTRSEEATTRTVERYATPIVILHWLIAALMIGNVALALSTELFPEPLVRPAIDTHKSLGILTLGLVLMRILWRLAKGVPPFSVGMKAWERMLAHATHFGLYAFMLMMPVTGWLHDSAWRDAASHPMRLFGLFEWPRIAFVANLPAAQKESLHALLGVIHGTGGRLLILLIALHILGALKHQLIDREPQFRRMWPAGEE